MTGVRSRLAFGLSVLGATGCMSTARIQNLPLSQGKERTFVADFDSLVTAARLAMEDDGLRVPHPRPHVAEPRGCGPQPLTSEAPCRQP